MKLYLTTHTFWAGFLVSVCMMGAQAQTMQVHKTSQMRQEPSSDATVLLELPAGTKVTRMPNKQGAYAQITTSDNQIGWVRMFDLSSVGAQQASDSTNTAKDALRGLTSLFGGGSKKPEATHTATMGIRGLGAEDIANAQPNMVSLAKLEAIRVSADDAHVFAARAAMQARQVTDLPAPPSPSTTSVNGPNQ